MEVFEGLTSEERFAVGRALVLRRVPTARWVGPKFVLGLVESDAKTVEDTGVLNELFHPNVRMRSNGYGYGYKVVNAWLTLWLGAEFRYFLDQLMMEGSVERRGRTARLPRSQAPKGGYALRHSRYVPSSQAWTEGYQPVRKQEVLEIRASDLASLHDEYMPERSKLALAALPMSSLTLLQILAQAAEDPEPD